MEAKMQPRRIGAVRPCARGLPEHVVIEEKATRGNHRLVVPGTPGM